MENNIFPHIFHPCCSSFLCADRVLKAFWFQSLFTLLHTVDLKDFLKIYQYLPD